MGEEIQPQPILFFLRSQAAIPLDDFPALQLSLTQVATPNKSQDFPDPVPVMVTTGVGRRIQKPGLPAVLELVDLCRDRGQQLVTFLVVSLDLLAPVCLFSGQRRVDVHLVGPVQERIQLEELPL